MIGVFEQLYRFKNLVGVKLGVNGVSANIKKREKTRKAPEIVRFRELFDGGEGEI